MARPRKIKEVEDVDNNIKTEPIKAEEPKNNNVITDAGIVYEKKG